MKRWLAVILFLAALLIGCSAASVTEFYERTPQRATSIGQGYTEYYRITRLPNGDVQVERLEEVPEGGEQP